MLTTRRLAREQNVAAPALLEMGKIEPVVLLAREAVIRQWDDGRLGQICDNHGVSDPGANGEAALIAAKARGDRNSKRRPICSPIGSMIIVKAGV